MHPMQCITFFYVFVYVFMKFTMYPIQCFITVSTTTNDVLFLQSAATSQRMVNRSPTTANLPTTLCHKYRPRRCPPTGQASTAGPSPNWPTAGRPPTCRRACASRPLAAATAVCSRRRVGRTARTARSTSSRLSRRRHLRATRVSGIGWIGCGTAVDLDSISVILLRDLKPDYAV